MGADHPERWAKGKRGKVAEMGAEWLRWTRAARDVSLPGVPIAALSGFCMNGDPWNTTGWKAGDQTERDAAVAKGRFPFKKKDPRDRSVYGSVTRAGDLHELGWYGTEAGKTPDAVATDPDCPWVKLATSEEVRKVLGRPAVTGPAWYGAIPDQCAIGVANLARHQRAMRRRLDPRLQWDPDDKRQTFWRWLLTRMTWSAGGRGAQHVNAYADELAAIPEAQRAGRFYQLAAAEDDDGNRHRQDEYSALRAAQGNEGAVVAVAELGDIGEPWALEWLRDDGLSDEERAAVYARLVDVSS